MSYTAMIRSSNCRIIITQEQQTQLAQDAIKSLIGAVARAFYTDDAIVVVDYLLQHKFLKDGRGMGRRMHLSTKQIRRTLQFLQDEHFVRFEQVSGIVETKDSVRVYRRRKEAGFWYIVYNRAFHSIRLRLHHLKTDLAQTRNTALTASTFVCPGYYNRYCDNGRYSEIEAQYCPVDDKGQFLCQQCVQQYGLENNGRDGLHSFVLELEDRSDVAKNAEQMLSRLTTQLSPWTISSEGGAVADNDGVAATRVLSLRPGILDLIQQIRHSKVPVSSNLPSENGAQDFLGNVEEESTTFQQEFAQETAGLVYFRTANGQRVALEIESGAAGSIASRMVAAAGHRRHSNDMVTDPASSPPPNRDNEKALVGGAAKIHVVGKKDGRIDKQSKDEKSQTTTTRKPLSNDPSALKVPRPEKMVCRQSTPFFLKNNINRGEEGAAQKNDVVERTRQLSIDDTASTANRSHITVDDSWRATPEAENMTASMFAEHFQLEFPRQKTLLSLTKASSFSEADLFASGCSLATADWEEC